MMKEGISHDFPGEIELEEDIMGEADSRENENT